jgi:hypothetical protein
MSDCEETRMDTGDAQSWYLCIIAIRFTRPATRHRAAQEFANAVDAAVAGQREYP